MIYLSAQQQPNKKRIRAGRNCCAVVFYRNLHEKAGVTESCARLSSFFFCLLFLFLFFSNRVITAVAQSSIALFNFLLLHSATSPAAVSTKIRRRTKETLSLCLRMYIRFDRDETRAMLDWEIPNIYVFINNSIGLQQKRK